MLLHVELLLGEDADVDEFLELLQRFHLFCDAHGGGVRGRCRAGSGGTLVFFASCLNIREILQERQKSSRTATEKEKSPHWLQGCNSKGGEETVY